MSLSVELKQPMQLLLDDRIQVTGLEVTDDLDVLISVENWHGIGIDWDFASLSDEEQRFLIGEIRQRDPDLAVRLSQEWLS